MKPGVYISIKFTGDADSAWLGAIGLIQVHHYTVYIYFLSRFFFFFFFFFFFLFLWAAPPALFVFMFCV